MNVEEFSALLDELGNKESEICEFKINNSNLELIGDSISALSNAAALHDSDSAYLFFGIDDSGKIIGTEFNPENKHKGQEIKNWLMTQLFPSVHFKIHILSMDNKRVIVFVIDAASGYPVKFKSKASIRVGSYTKPLSKHLGEEKALWQKLSSRQFENAVALHDLSAPAVLDKLDYRAYYRLKNVNVGTDSETVLEKMQADKLIQKSKGKYSITNLGAILAARDMGDFDNLQRKIPRLIIYQGTSRINAIHEIVIQKGYILSLPMLIDHILGNLPVNEEIEKVFRKERKLYPEVAIRELVVNALIHQDLLATGMSPTIEIFADRIEIRNPGKPLISTDRFIDATPQSRNEKLAKEMRLLGFCEERGSGVDRVVHLCEVYQLPAPLISADSASTHITLYAPKKLTRMNKADKIRATYLHACLRFVSNELMTNKSLRERFDINEKNYPQASRILRDTIDAGFILVNPSSAKSKEKSYIPFWAKSNDM